MRLTLTALGGWIDLDLRIGEPADEGGPVVDVLSDIERADDPIGFAPPEPDEGD